MDEGTNFYTWVKPAANIAKGYVLLENDIPAGTYTPRDARLFGDAFSDSARKAEGMHAVIAWLIETGMPDDKVEAAVHALLKKQDSDALISALAPLLGKWA